MILEKVVDRFIGNLREMILFNSLIKFCLTLLLTPLCGGMHVFYGAWLRFNSLEWNSHSASLRLALHRKKPTLHPIQLPFPG